MFVLFVLATVFTAYCVRAAPTGAPAAPTGCSGGIRESDTVERGRYWYICQNGELIQKGCLSEKKLRLNAGQTYITGAYQMECAADGSNGFVFKYKGCVSETQEPHPTDSTWQDDNYWYQCMADNGVPKIVIQGCVYEGKRSNIGDSLKIGDLIYTCNRKADGTMGFDIFPNQKDKDVTYVPGDDMFYKKQNVPVYINTR